MKINDDEQEDLRASQLISWHYKHAQDHFSHMIQAIEDGEMSDFLDRLEQLAGSLDVKVDLDEVQDSIYAF